jgi:hypothetical protein
LVSHNGFTGSAVGHVGLLDLQRQLSATHRGSSVTSNMGLSFVDLLLLLG